MKEGGMEEEGKGKVKKIRKFPHPGYRFFLLCLWGAGLKVSLLYGVLPSHPGKTGMLSEPAVLAFSPGTRFCIPFKQLHFAVSIQS